MAVSTLLVYPVLGCTKPYNHNHWNRQLTRAVALLNSSTHSLLSHRFQSDPMFVHWPDFYVAFWVLLLDFQDEPTQIFFSTPQVMRISDSSCWGRGTLNRNFMDLRYSHSMQRTDFFTLEFTHPIGYFMTIPQPSGGGCCRICHNHRLFHIIQQRVTIGIWATLLLQRWSPRDSGHKWLYSQSNS